MALLLTACAPVGPDYQPPRPDLPARWSMEQKSHAAAPVESNGRWWHLFNDPLLSDLISRAITANQDLRIAGSRIKAARARYRITAADSAPSLAASAAYTHSRRSENTGATGGSQDLENTGSTAGNQDLENTGSTAGNRDLYEAGFDADWEIDLFGGQRRAIEAATATFAASQENRRDVLITLEAEVARNYFELRGSQRQLATAKDNLAAQAMTLATVQGRFRLGLVSRLEVVQAQTQKSLLAALLPALEKKIAQSTSQLALLLNLQTASLASRLAQPAVSPEFPQSLPAGLPSDLLRRRPDIRRAERQLAAASAEIGVATADLFPRFSLTALAGLQSSSLSDLVSSGSRFWSLGPSLSLPLFNREKLQAAVEITEAQQEEMLAGYEKAVLAALIETENTLILFSREQETRSSLAEAVKTGRQAVTLSEGLYKSGLTDLTDVLTSQRTQYQAEDQLIGSEQQLALYTIALYKALGGGWEIAEQAASGLSPADRQTHQKPSK